MKKLSRKEKKILISNEKTYLSKGNVEIKTKYWKLKTKLWIWKMNRLAKKYDIDLYADDTTQGHFTIPYTKADGSEAIYEFAHRPIAWLQKPDMGIREIIKGIEHTSEPTRKIAFAIKVPFIITEKLGVATFGDYCLLRRK